MDKLNLTEDLTHKLKKLNTQYQHFIEKISKGEGILLKIQASNDKKKFQPKK